MTESSSVKRNILASWGAHAIALVIGFFLLPYVLGVLGTEQYGTWVYINSMASYAGLLYFGFGETISRYVAKYHSEQRIGKINEIVSLVLAVYLAMGLLAIAIAVGLSCVVPFLSDWKGVSQNEVRLVILLLGLNVFMGMAGSVFGGVLLGLRRFDLERAVSFSSDIARLVLIVVFLRQEYGLVTIAAIYLFITFAESVAFAVMAWRILPELALRPSFVNKQVFLESSSFSGMAFVNAVAAQLIYATDTIVIGTMLGSSEVVPYYIGMRLAQFIRQPIDKIAHICMPTAGALQQVASRPKLHRLLLQAFGVTFLLASSALMGAWFFGGAVIHAWMGPGFPESHTVLVVLLAAQAVALPMAILRAFLFGQGAVKIPAAVYLLEAAANLGLSIWLCRSYGILGVAYGTAIPIFVFELFVLLPYALRKLDVSGWTLLTKSVLPQLLPLGTLGAYCLLLSSAALPITTWPVLIAITIGGAAVCAAMWFVGNRFRPA